MQDERGPYLPPGSTALVNLKVARLFDTLAELDKKIEKTSHRVDFWGIKTLVGCKSRMEAIYEEMIELIVEAPHNQSLQALQERYAIILKNFKQETQHLIEELGW